MYNKLFSKIVDSSIWLEPTPTRIVWLMFIAVMNEDGFVQFASVANVAHRARITDEESEQAIKILEDPDPNSADEENDGRRIEKVPGGWMILNAHKYRDLVTREMIREQTRKRVARKRAKDKGVTLCNADVTPRNAKVTPSDTDTDTKKERGAYVARPRSINEVLAVMDEKSAREFWDYYESNGWRVGRNPMKMWKAAASRWVRNKDSQKNGWEFSRPRPKERAPIYPKMTESREPTEAELENARRIAHEETARFKEQFK